MVYKVKDRNAESADTENISGGGCPHYWLIESASGPMSWGTCKICGVEKEFYNSKPDVVTVKKGNGVLKISKLPGIDGIEDEEEQSQHVDRSSRLVVR